MNRHVKPPVFPASYVPKFVDRNDPRNWTAIYHLKFGAWLIVVATWVAIFLGLRHFGIL